MAGDDVAAEDLHTKADAIVAWYSYHIGVALGAIFTRELIDECVAAVAAMPVGQSAPLLKEAAPAPSLPPKKAILAMVQKVLQGAASPDDLLKVVQELRLDSYISGAVAAALQAHLPHVLGVLAGAGASGPSDLMTGITGPVNSDFWSHWTPGWRGAADTIQQNGGLAQVLANSNLTVKGLVNTTINQIGTYIAQGLARGDSHLKVAQDVQTMVQDPKRAKTIANTEYARAMTTATYDTYAANDIERVIWLAEQDACPKCAANAAAGPVQPHNFPNGDVPQHPNCRCAIVPDVDSILQNAGVVKSDAWSEVLKWSATTWLTELRGPHGEWIHGLDIKAVGIGATGAKLVTTPSGSKFIAKQGGAPETEAAADAVYHKAEDLGLMGDKSETPESVLTTIDGKATRITKHVGPAVPLHKFTGEDFEQHAKDVQKGFAVDALLRNWDIGGMENNTNAEGSNILIGPGGKVHRIDSGGAFGKTALGGEKSDGFKNVWPTDIWSMRDPSTAPVGSKVFGQMSFAAIVGQMAQVGDHYAELANAVPEEMDSGSKVGVAGRARKMGQLAAAAQKMHDGGMEWPDIDKALRTFVEANPTATPSQLKDYAEIKLDTHQVVQQLSKPKTNDELSVADAVTNKGTFKGYKVSGNGLDLTVTTPDGVSHGLFTPTAAKMYIEDHMSAQPISNLDKVKAKVAADGKAIIYKKQGVTPIVQQITVTPHPDGTLHAQVSEIDMNKGTGAHPHITPTVGDVPEKLIEPVLNSAGPWSFHDAPKDKSVLGPTYINTLHPSDQPDSSEEPQSLEDLRAIAEANGMKTKVKATETAPSKTGGGNKSIKLAGHPHLTSIVAHPDGTFGVNGKQNDKLKVGTAAEAAKYLTGEKKLAKDPDQASTYNGVPVTPDVKADNVAVATAQPTPAYFQNVTPEQIDELTQQVGTIKLSKTGHVVTPDASSPGDYYVTMPDGLQSQVPVNAKGVLKIINGETIVHPDGSISANKPPLGALHPVLAHAKANPGTWHEVTYNGGAKAGVVKYDPGTDKYMFSGEMKPAGGTGGVAQGDDKAKTKMAAAEAELGPLNLKNDAGVGSPQETLSQGSNSITAHPMLATAKVGQPVFGVDGGDNSSVGLVAHPDGTYTIIHHGPNKLEHLSAAGATSYLNNHKVTQTPSVGGVPEHHEEDQANSEMPHPVDEALAQGSNGFVAVGNTGYQITSTIADASMLVVKNPDGSYAFNSNAVPIQDVKDLVDGKTTPAVALEEDTGQYSEAAEQMVGNLGSDEGAQSVLVSPSGHAYTAQNKGDDYYSLTAPNGESLGSDIHGQTNVEDMLAAHLSEHPEYMKPAAPIQHAIATLLNGGGEASGSGFKTTLDDGTKVKYYPEHQTFTVTPVGSVAQTKLSAEDADVLNSIPSAKPPAPVHQVELPQAYAEPEINISGKPSTGLTSNISIEGTPGEGLTDDHAKASVARLMQGNTYLLENPDGAANNITSYYGVKNYDRSKTIGFKVKTADGNVTHVTNAAALKDALTGKMSLEDAAKEPAPEEGGRTFNVAAMPPTADQLQGTVSHYNPLWNGAEAVSAPSGVLGDTHGNGQWVLDHIIQREPYTPEDQDGVTWLKSDSYKKGNNFIRQGKAKDMQPHDRKMLQQLQRAQKKAVAKDDIVVVRSFQGDILKGVRPGDLIVDPTPHSIGSDINSWSGSYKYEIHIPKGSPVVSPYSKLPNGQRLQQTNTGESEPIQGAAGQVYRVITMKGPNGLPVLETLSGAQTDPKNLLKAEMPRPNVFSLLLQVELAKMAYA